MSAASSDVDEGSDKSSQKDRGSSKSESKSSIDALISKSSKPKKDTKQGGRVFNIKQLSFIIKEYDHDPKPTVAKIEEISKVMNSPDFIEDDGAYAPIASRQVKTWFSNRRAKERTDYVKARLKEAQESGVSKDEIDKVKTEAEAEHREILNKRSKGRKRKASSISSSKSGSTASSTPSRPKSPESNNGSETEDDEHIPMSKTLQRNIRARKESSSDTVDKSSRSEHSDHSSSENVTSVKDSPTDGEEN